MSDNDDVPDPDPNRPSSRGHTEGDWGNGAIIGTVVSMVTVMAVIAFTLHRNSPLVATAPIVTASEPSTTGQGGLAPVHGRSGIDR